MLDLDFPKHLRNWLYNHMSDLHKGRWESFSRQASSIPRLRITMFIRNHQGADQAAIVDSMVENGQYASRDSCASVVVRNLREMEKTGEIELRGNGYYAHKTRFVIKEEEPWFSWFFIASTGLGIAFLAYSIWTTPLTIHTAYAVVFLSLIFLKLLDDAIHTSSW